MTSTFNIDILLCVGTLLCLSPVIGCSAADNRAEYTVHCTLQCNVPMLQALILLRSHLYNERVKTRLFDKSIFCQHLNSCLRVSCLQESPLLPQCLSLSPPPVVSAVSADMGRLLPSRRVSGSYPPPSHSRHSESSLPSPSRLTADTRRLLHGDLQQPAAGVQRGAGTCSWPAAPAYTGLIQMQGASRELQHSA